MTEPDGAVRCEDLPSGVRVVTLLRPTSRNALTRRMLASLEKAFAQAGGVRALVLEGEGTAFCSGYDLDCLEEDSVAGRIPDSALQQVFRLLEEAPFPSVAVVQGAAFGAGCELACACDFRVGSPDAVFCLPSLKLGIVYAPDGLWRLAQLVGLQRTREMLLTGRTVGSETALRWGLLDRLEPDAVAAGRALAEELVAAAPLAMAGTRLALSHLERAPLSEVDRFELEKVRAQAFASQDAAEGRAAVRERRPPRFRGQ
ncbi:MAG: enoyl-CoA hydratase/isomerase family protein [Myxococcaceae bacterium]